jgi:hypothetical protein
MTPIQMRVAIAELCGWHDFQYDGFGNELPVIVKSPSGKMHSGAAIPDYPNSLDAMHEAEETFKDANHQLRYSRMLRDVYDDSLLRMFAAMHAPAHVRAKVFLELHQILKNEAANSAAYEKAHEHVAGQCNKCGAPTFGLICAKCKGEPVKKEFGRDEIYRSYDPPQKRR